MKKARRHGGTEARCVGLLPVCMIVLMAGCTLNGCAAVGIASAMAQSAEYQKLKEVPAVYTGLENRTYAVIADADMAVLYEHPDLVATVVGGVSHRIASRVPSARMLSPQAVIAWQYRTPQWNAMPYSEVVRELNVDRVILVDIYEYRLNPPGNAWLWEGVCSANVTVIERDAIDPDAPVDTFFVQSDFPNIKGVAVDTAGRDQIVRGLMYRFIQKTAWLFYDHEEPKYPDKYEGPPPENG